MTPRGIAAIAAADPDRVAILCGSRRLTYGELDRRANQVAHALAAAGVGHGSRVAVMLTNRPDVFTVWNGVARLGALVVPISYRSVAAEAAYIVEDSGATVLVHDEHTAAAAPPPAGGLAAVWSVDDTAFDAADTTPPTGEFLGATVTTMVYTSGTTGRPKGIVRGAPHPAREYPRNPFADRWGFGADDVHLMCGPSYHTAPGTWAQIHLMEGAPVVIMERFDADTCLALIAEHRVTTSHMVPANFIRILEADWERYDRSSVRTILHAAAPCPVPVKRRIMEVFPPGAIWEYYGASEGMGTVISPEEWQRKPGSVGRPFPGLTISIRDEAGDDIAPGEVGFIYISNMDGIGGFEYHNAPDKTRSAYQGEFFTVGDMGSVDEDGYLFIADRRTDLVIRGGVNIYPAEIEQALAEHPDVVDSAVFGVPDERMGQEVHAVVELRPGAGTDTAALLDHLGARLAKHKLPRTLDLVDELPREPNGKVLKRRLRDAHVAALGRV